jgi:AraC-like DNA-binding protein
MFLSFPTLFLFGPLHYFYVKVLTDRTIVFKPVHLLHFLPFALIVIGFIPVYLLPVQQKLEMVHDTLSEDRLHNGLTIGTIQVFHVFAYITMSFKVLKGYDERILSTRSTIEKINLRWLHFGIACFAVTFGLILIFIVLDVLGFHKAIVAYNIAIPILVSIIIYIMGYWGMRQPEIFSPGEEQFRKYEKSTLTETLSGEYVQRLRTMMEIEKPYINPDLTLPALASRIGIPPHHLSQIINESLQQNFFDFVNSHRIEEAKRLMQTPGKSAYTLLAIAGEAGFNSKTSFNAAFKKYTGMTPSEFRNTLPA